MDFASLPIEVIPFVATACAVGAGCLQLMASRAAASKNGFGLARAALNEKARITTPDGELEAHAPAPTGAKRQKTPILTDTHIAKLRVAPVSSDLMAVEAHRVRINPEGTWMTVDAGARASVGAYYNGLVCKFEGGPTITIADADLDKWEMVVGRVTSR